MLLRPSRLGDSSHVGRRDTSERDGLLNILLSPSHPRYCLSTLIPKAKWTPWTTLIPSFAAALERPSLEITDAMDVNFSKLWEMVRDREAWRAAVDGVAKT